MSHKTKPNQTSSGDPVSAESPSLLLLPGPLLCGVVVPSEGQKDLYKIFRIRLDRVQKKVLRNNYEENLNMNMIPKPLGINNSKRVNVPWNQLIKSIKSIKQSNPVPPLFPMPLETV